MVFCISGVTDHLLPATGGTLDDAAQPGVTVVYDGVARTHGRHTAIPGSVAWPIDMYRSGPIVLHEFCHAVSDSTSGFISDLYVDEPQLAAPPPAFRVNKKWRAAAAHPVPAAFATYNGTAFAADPVRDGIGYPASWISFHPALLDATRPNLMDDVWRAGQGPAPGVWIPEEAERCRLDALTFRWLYDRLRAKVLR